MAEGVLMRSELSKQREAIARESYLKKQILEDKMSCCKPESQELFLVAVILRPTNAQSKDGALPEIIVPLTAVLAFDEAGAVLEAGRLIADKHSSAKARLEVRVRPFCGD